jgi:succinoglycan biosynthesis transport protein ExoP
MFQNPRGFSASVPAAQEGQPTRATTSAIFPRLGLETDWAFIWRHRRWVLIGIGAALFLNLAAELTFTPRYRAVTQILIGPVDLRGVDKSVMPPAQTADANVIEVESETRVLTSDKVLHRVVETERLLTDPEFYSNNGSRIGTIVSLLEATVGLKSKPAPTNDGAFGAVRQLQRDVTARRTERTYVVDLTVETSDGVKSARLANAIVQAYFAEQSAAHSEAARRVTESLTSRLTELRERVRHAEEEVERYKAEQGIVGANGRLVDEQQLTELNNQLTSAQAHTAEARARYEQVQRLQGRGADRGSTSEAVQSNTVGLLREQYAAVAQREANLTAELGPQHPYVVESRAQVRNAQRLITEEVGRVADATHSEYERALANEEALANNLHALKQRAMATGLAFVKLRELEREVDASRAVYESFLGRASETREQERLDTVNVRVLSDAQAPLERSWPPRRLILLLAALGAGLLGGVGLAYAAEQIGRKSRPNAQANPPTARAA